MESTAVQAIQAAYGTWVATGFVVAMVLLASVAIFYDVRERRVPNNLSLAIFAGGIIFCVLSDPVWPGLRTSVAGFAVGFGIWIPFYAIGVMGAGDVKLFAALSAWLGPSLSWRAALLAGLFGGILAVAFLLRDRRLAHALRRIALLPFLRTLKTSQVVDLSEDEVRRQLPYGVALGLGAIIAFLLANVFETGTIL